MSEDNLDRNRSFFRRWARTYDHLIFQFWMRRFYRPVLDQVDPREKAKIMDVSCGTGELLRELSKRDNGHNLLLYGIDLTGEMLQVAGRKLPESVVLQEGDVHRLPFSDEEFDYVVSTEAFHHYQDQRIALQEMARVAKKSGEVIIIDVNFLWSLIHRLFAALEPGCVKINSRKEMRQLFEDAGLRVEGQKRVFLFAVMTKGFKK